MTDIPCVILAGGLARRMGGGDKALKRVGAKTILDRVIARMATQAQQLALNANGDPERFAAFGLPVIADGVADYPGPLAGILAGMRWAGGFGARRVATVAADGPFLPRDLIMRLALATTPVATAASGGFTHPVIGVFDVALADDLEAALLAGERKIDRWTARHGVSEIEWPVVPFDPFFNANSPDDLAAAEAVLKDYPEA
jgi:molybdopterin-guanine dinucleotide biosynthesis protein A